MNRLLSFDTTTRISALALYALVVLGLTGWLAVLACLVELAWWSACQLIRGTSVGWPPL
jgi:hypothetical protein